MRSYHPDDPKMLGNWFDVHDKEHLRAWQELESSGSWPAWFQETMDAARVIIHQQWAIVIQNKMAKAWVESQFTGKG